MTRSERRLALRRCSATAIAGLCVLPSTQAFAQTTPTVAVEEIVVTARKREESLQEVPLSISAFTEKTIEAAGITDIEDISRLTPGFTFAPLFGGAAGPLTGLAAVGAVVTTRPPRTWGASVNARF